MEAKRGIAWCPGCGNFAIRDVLEKTLPALPVDPSRIVITSGIGQAAKMPHYLKVNYFNGLHGRSLPLACGIKLARPDLTVIAYSVDGNGPVGTTTLTAQPETQPVFQPLFTAATSLQPDPVTETPTAKITRWADRARDRHAREGVGVLFRDGPAAAAAYKYDHYLSFYWEQRVAEMEIVDEVAKGGNRVVFNFTTQVKLNPAEFRTFFNIGSPLSGYHLNQSDYLNAGVTLLSSNASSR